MADNSWLDCDAEKMTSWQCKLKVQWMLGIKWWTDSEVSSDGFVQDVFAWTTFFIWTIVAVSLIAASLMMIFAWWEQTLAAKWKKWVQWAIIWLLLVIFSYWFVRLIWFLAAWG